MKIMKHGLMTLDDVDVKGKKVLIRFDLNSTVTIDDPQDPDDGEVIYRAAFKPNGGYLGTNAQSVWIRDNHGNIKRIYIISTTGAVEINDTPPS